MICIATVINLYINIQKVKIIIDGEAGADGFVIPPPFATLVASSLPDIDSIDGSPASKDSLKAWVARLQNTYDTMSCRKHLQIRFCFVIHCKQLSEICAHYVTHLELAGAWRAYALKDLSSLAEATFDFNVYHFPWGGKRSDQVTNLSTMDNIFKSMSSSVKSFFLLGSR